MGNTLKGMVHIDAEKLHADINNEGLAVAEISLLTGYSTRYVSWAIDNKKCRKAFLVALANRLGRKPEYYILPDEPKPEGPADTVTDTTQNINGDIIKAIKDAATEAYTAVNLNTSGAADAIKGAITKQTQNNAAYHQDIVERLISIDRHLGEIADGWAKYQAKMMKYMQDFYNQAKYGRM